MVENHSNLTPEKQLLKLIEEPQSAVALKGAAGPSKVSARAVAGQWRFLSGNLLARAEKFMKAPDIGVINFLLGLLAFLVGAYFVASSIILARRLSELPNFSFSPAKKAAAQVFSPVSGLKTLSFYLEKAQARDLFHLGPKKEEAPAASTEQVSAKTQEEIFGKYRLVGISWSDNPDAMIENTTQGKTYFLKRGQSLDNARVSAIFKDKVILNYNGQEFELR